MKNLNVIELFAGVGGFHLGLTKASKIYKIIWSNQWEPSTKSQPASECNLLEEILIQQQQTKGVLQKELVSLLHQPLLDKN